MSENLYKLIFIFKSCNGYLDIVINSFNLQNLLDRSLKF